MSVETEAVTAIIAGFRAMADQLEQILAGDDAAAVVAHVGRPYPLGAVFDPDVDTPPVIPKVRGEREEMDWCVIVLFGRLRALNVRERRGANENEQRAIGNAAGYKGRAAFNGWLWTWRDDSDGRWITDDDDLTAEDKAKGRLSGMGFLREYAARRNIMLPADLA